jgi:hypothetical protein
VELFENVNLQAKPKRSQERKFAALKKKSTIVSCFALASRLSGCVDERTDLSNATAEIP